MSLPKYYADDDGLARSWEALGHGAPTIIALAKLCSQAISGESPADAPLSPESKAILYAARERGVIAVNGSNQAFDSVDRFLSIHVETDNDTVLAFKSKRDPQLTVRYVDAFKELCRSGLVMHQLFREFSLSSQGFARAGQIQEEEVAEQLAEGIELGRHEW